MSNFISLLTFGQSAGLGRGNDGACHIINLPASLLIPRDVESGKISADVVVVAFDYGTHVSFAVRQDSKDLANERPLYTFADLVGLLTAALVNPPDDEHDEVIEEMRRHAIASLDNQLEDDEEDFYDDEAVAELDSGEEVVEDEDADEPVEIALTKPSAKVGTKKYKKELEDMVAVLNEYYADELESCEMDNEVLADALDAVFDEVDEIVIHTGVGLLDQLSEFVEFE